MKGTDAAELKKAILAGLTDKDATGRSLGPGDRASSIREARTIGARGAGAKQEAEEAALARRSPTFKALNSMDGSLKTIAGILSGENKKVDVTVNITKDEAEGGTGTGAFKGAKTK